MAYHFSANQFQDQYSPRKLGNWEYPKWYPERPRQRYKSTKVIADDCGRLLDGIKRENPWGNYVGTWDLPRRITREYVSKLVAPPERLVKLWEKKKKEDQKSEEQPQQSEAEKEKTESLPTIDHNSNSSINKSYKKRNKSSSALDLRPRPTKLEPIVSQEKSNESLHGIRPGNLDEKIKNILDSVETKQDNSVEHPEFICKEIKAIPRNSKRKEDAYRTDDGNGNLEFMNYSDDNLHKFETIGTNSEDEKQSGIDLTRFDKPEEEKSSMEKSIKTPENKSLETLKSSYSSFQIAKRFHDENLRHKPLPDVIDDPVFKALYSGRQPCPDGALNSIPSAIGWKPYSAPRPTDCSKLKVFRPKTGTDKPKSQKDCRPKTVDSTYKKRFSPIDLAICWDLKPDNPSDEPKRSPHIDGSNGSIAPAVFTMIRPLESEEADQNVSSSSQALAERITKGIDEDNAATLPSQTNSKTRSPMPITSNKEAILTCIKTSRENSQKPNTPESLNSISPNAAEYARRHPKTAWTNEYTRKVLSDRLQHLKGNWKFGKLITKKSGLSKSPSESSQITKKNHHQSTPNLVAACDGSHCGTEKSSSGSEKFNQQSKSRICERLNVVNDEIKNRTMAGNKSSNEKTLKNGQKKRNCSACKKSLSDCHENHEKTEFKAAFKAGVPRSESTSSGSSSAAKSYKVPKMRLPYAKRSYSIGTLAPPFSVWRENSGQEYPEHWRLASVYQHSYKPINFRKRPLLASVYQ